MIYFFVLCDCGSLNDLWMLKNQYTLIDLAEVSMVPGVEYWR